MKQFISACQSVRAFLENKVSFSILHLSSSPFVTPSRDTSVWSGTMVRLDGHRAFSKKRAWPVPALARELLEATVPRVL
ncbi:hypothetical protein WJX77_005057 [Trebouxia sp. C0004]